MTTRALLMAVLLAALVCVPLTAQEKKEKEDPFGKMPKPGPEHKLLATMAGTYDARVKAWFGPGEPKTSTGTMMKEMILDERYLLEKFTGAFDGKPFKGIGLLGYDTNKKKYFMSWVDSFATGIDTSYGTCEGGKTFTFVGEVDHPDSGGKMKTRDVLKIVSEREQVFEMYRTPEKTGKEFKVMEITYTKKP
jgi:hypothetical protein